MRKPTPAKKALLVVGVTGGCGSGKSTVVRLLRSLGARVIDADEIGHRLLLPGSKVHKRIVRQFGRNFLAADGSIDRGRLGRHVFANKGLLSRLNRLIHPEIIKGIKKRIREGGRGLVVVDAPLLFEVGFDKQVDRTVVVVSSQKLQIGRILKKRPALGRAGALERIRSQMPLRVKALNADFIIDNNGPISKTRKQVKQLFEKLLSLLCR